MAHTPLKIYLNTYIFSTRKWSYFFASQIRTEKMKMGPHLELWCTSMYSKEASNITKETNATILSLISTKRFLGWYLKMGKFMTESVMGSFSTIESMYRINPIFQFFLRHPLKFIRRKLSWKWKYFFFSLRPKEHEMIFKNTWEEYVLDSLRT